MKKATLPVVCLILAVTLLGQINPVNNSENTFYYFCVSHAKYSSGKQVILYTKVYQITCEEKNIPEKTKEWATLVEKSCENPTGCTSDLNYYRSKEDAEKQFESTKHLYRDAGKYTLKLVELK